MNEFPEAWGVRRAYRRRGPWGELRGRAYGDLPEGFAATAARWIADGSVAGGEDLGGARVFRHGALVAKFFPATRVVASWFRPAASLRTAELYFKLRPIRTPRPLLAVEGRGPLRGRPSLLVSEFLDGALLKQTFGSDAAATAALPGFLAAMHARGVFHGDLHPWNLMWHAGSWVLLDVNAVRAGLHRLRSRRLVTGQWARLVTYLDDRDLVERAFRAYLREADPSADAPEAWRRLLAEAKRFDANRRIG